MFLTAYNGSILGPIARVLGWIMDKIYVFLTETCGIMNGSIALSIILFTILIYVCMFPLTYKQQKFSMLNRKMQPEMTAIRKKYQGKKDQASMAAMQEETTALYDKYGVSPTGSCIQMVIQMPILFALYRVFYNVPAYIHSVKTIFTPLVDGIIETAKFKQSMTALTEKASLRGVQVDFTVKDNAALRDYIVDVLYKLSDEGWNECTKLFPNLTNEIDSVKETLFEVNYFFILNISDTPWHTIQVAWSHKEFGLIIFAVLIPVFAYLSQVLNLKMMPAMGGDDQMAQKMKTMNTMMPLMSLFFVFITPIGLGLYWIVGALVRTVQQFFLNRHFEKINLNDIIEKNKESAAKKAEKRGQMRIAANAQRSTRSMSEKAIVSEEKNELLDKAASLRSTAKKGSMSQKANLVKDFNEGNLKK